MRTRIEIDDVMVERALNETAWKRCPSSTLNMRKILEAALGKLLERRTSEGRKCLQVGAYAPEGNTAKGENGAAPAADGAVEPCKHEWAMLCFNPMAWPKDAPQVRCSKCGVVQARRATDPKAAPAKPAAVEDNDRVVFTRDKEPWKVECVEQFSDESWRIDLVGKGGDWVLWFKVTDQWRWPDRTPSEPTVGATHAPSQASTRPSASTTAAPEVSEAMLDAGYDQWVNIDEFKTTMRDTLSNVFRAMYLKMLEEQGK